MTYRFENCLAQLLTTFICNPAFWGAVFPFTLRVASIPASPPRTLILEWLFLLRIGETTIRNKLACTTGPKPAWAARCLWVWCKLQALVYDISFLGGRCRKAMLGVWVWWGSSRQWPVAAWGSDLNRQGSTHSSTHPLPWLFLRQEFPMRGPKCAGSSVADTPIGSHSERHRFPAPSSLKEGCCKPVLGVCHRMWAPWLRSLLSGTSISYLDFLEGCRKPVLLVGDARLDFSSSCQGLGSVRALQVLRQGWRLSEWPAAERQEYSLSSVSDYQRWPLCAAIGTGPAPLGFLRMQIRQSPSDENILKSRSRPVHAKKKSHTLKIPV